MSKANQKEFLTELSALTSKHGIKIGGCGCCGSPWLNFDEKPGGVYKCDDESEYLTYHEPEQPTKEPSK